MCLFRFSRLLHKKKFLEAEQFAKMFGLDVQVCRLVFTVLSGTVIERYLSKSFNSLSANPTKWSNTLKQFGKSRRIV